MDRTATQTLPGPSDAADRIRHALDKLAALQGQVIDLQEFLTDALLTLQAAAQPSGGSASPRNGTDPPADTAEVPQTVDLEKWLRDRDITIKQRRLQNPFDASFDRLAVFLGRHFENLRAFYGAIKTRLAGRSYPRSLSLQKLPPEQISELIKFGQDLHRNGFLKDFRYLKHDRLIRFDPQADGRVTNFFTGGWLERYVVLSATEYLTKQQPESPVVTLMNPQVVLPNGQDFEVDILMASSSTVLWFECKTGANYPAYVTKYGTVAQQFMQMDRNHAALVLLEELTEEEKANNSQFAQMSVLNLDDIGAFLASVAGETDQGEPAGPAQITIRPSIVPAGQSDLSTLLRRANVRPLEVGERRRILTDLIAQRSAAQGKVPLRDLVVQLKARYEAEQVAVSKSKINDVSTALIRSGCCERGSHPDYASDVWFLRGDLSADGAFDACSRLYIWTCLKTMGAKEITDNDVRAMGQIVWGDGMQDAHTSAMEIIEQLIHSGQCTRQKMDGRIIVHALGDGFVQ
jgi:hypothetical protein